MGNLFSNNSGAQRAAARKQTQALRKQAQAAQAQSVAIQRAQAQQSQALARAQAQARRETAALQNQFQSQLATTSQSIQKGIEGIPLPSPTRSPTEMDPGTIAAATRMRERARGRRGRQSTILTS